MPGQLIWAKRIGTSAGEASAWAVAGGPGGVVAIAGWQSVAPTGQVPMVARLHRRRRALGQDVRELPAAPRTWPSTSRQRLRRRDRRPGPAGDIVVLKYDAAGVFQWATTPYDGTGGGSPDAAREIAVDGAGNVSSPARAS